MVWNPYRAPHVMAADTAESRLRHLAPLPRRIETVALWYAWVIVAINLTATAFGFWYYIPQFRLEPGYQPRLRPEIFPTDRWLHRLCR